jgi:hypothetical protein
MCGTPHNDLSIACIPDRSGKIRDPFGTVYAGVDLRGKIAGGTMPVDRFVRPPRHGSPLLVAR